MPPIEGATKIVANGRLKSHDDETIARDVVQLARTDLLDTLVAYAPDHALGWMESMRAALYVVTEKTQKEVGK